jgi:hypothetical protein
MYPSVEFANSQSGFAIRLLMGSFVFAKLPTGIHGLYLSVESPIFCSAKNALKFF